MNPNCAVLFARCNTVQHDRLSSVHVFFTRTHGRHREIAHPFPSRAKKTSPGRSTPTLLDHPPHPSPCNVDVGLRRAGAREGNDFFATGDLYPPRCVRSKLQLCMKGGGCTLPDGEGTFFRSGRTQNSPGYIVSNGKMRSTRRSTSRGFLRRNSWRCSKRGCCLQAPQEPCRNRVGTVWEPCGSCVETM